MGGRGGGWNLRSEVPNWVAVPGFRGAGGKAGLLALLPGDQHLARLEEEMDLGKEGASLSSPGLTVLRALRRNRTPA